MVPRDTAERCTQTPGLHVRGWVENLSGTQVWATGGPVSERGFLGREKVTCSRFSVIQVYTLYLTGCKNTRGTLLTRTALLEARTLCALGRSVLTPLASREFRQSPCRRRLTAGLRHPWASVALGVPGGIALVLECLLLYYLL